MRSSRKIDTMPETTPTPEIKPEPKTLVGIIHDLRDRVETLEKRAEEVHVHAHAKLDKAQFDEIVKQAAEQFGAKIGTEIRANFGNI